MIIVGIDPGLDGALAFLDTRGTARAVTMPTVKGARGRQRYDLPAIRRLLQEAMPRWTYIEEVSPAPVRGRAQGALSMFSFGRGLGQLEGLLAGLGLPYVLVRPQTWKAAVLAGTGRGKADAVAWAQRRYPGVDLCPGRRRVAHHGVAEALAIAEYGRRAEASEHGKEAP